MSEGLDNRDPENENETEQTREQILDVLELAFNSKGKVLLIESSGNMIEAFIVGLEEGFLSIRTKGMVKRKVDGVEREIEELVEIGIELDRVKKVEAI